MLTIGLIAAGIILIVAAGLPLLFMHTGDRIVLNSRLARLLTPSTAYAITLGRITYVRGDRAWPQLLAHEDGHRQLQWKKYGFWTFAALYLAELARHGYRNSKWEVEAVAFAAAADLSKYPDLHA